MSIIPSAERIHPRLAAPVGLLVLAREPLADDRHLRLGVLERAVGRQTRRSR